jgi:pSer/pThr/pTyr-binding forkhead associated (FHA) protein
VKGRTAILEQVHGRGTGRRYRLPLPHAIIGRSLQCDLQLPEDGVSRRHARIERHDDRFVLVDLGSKNGTYVDDVPVQHTPLEEGDLLKLGPLLFRFSTAPASADEPAPTGSAPPRGGSAPPAAPATLRARR